ncbi:MAG TPA: dipeptide epimerase [Hellea balneolensis]|uniref:Dipeptide epimerase n=1 Tax=Hellea balneolensis TaxID=287478 RepID=A0A7C5R0Z6_9PROT|nr:dipeptide epimerase [Hellea balneolensis]
MRHISIQICKYPIRGTFRIAHGTVSEVEVVQVDITEHGMTGRGECRPYPRYGESTKSVTREIKKIRNELEAGMTIQALQSALPAGAARNAVDCALWDLAAKSQDKPVWELAKIAAPRPRTTAYTLSIDTPQNMRAAALEAKTYPVLKLKIGGPDGLEGITAILSARPDVQLIVDANESLMPEDLAEFRRVLANAPVLMIEQPLPSDIDGQIDNTPNARPRYCADESLHTRDDLSRLWEAGYRAINVKLDKCGGFTEALALMNMARDMGFMIMAGCMVGSSLAMAPMAMLESFADVIDLDGPLLLAQDVENGLRFDGAVMHPPPAKLWG